MRTKLMYALSALVMVTMMFVTSCKENEPVQPEPPVQSYSVSFNANGGSGTMQVLRGDEGETVTLTANSFTREDYSFSGWNTKSDGTGTSYADKAKVKLSANLTLYAQWIADAATTFEVTFEANGGEGTMDNQVVEEGKETALAANSFTREDYSFSGWNTKSDGSGTSYANGAKVTLSANLTLFAQWVESSSTIAVTGITLDKATLTLEPDEFYDPQLVATITPSNATNKKVIWSSSDEDVLYIDNPNGDIITFGGGTATITATTEDGGFTATCKVTVEKPAQAGLMLADIDADNIPEGDTWTIVDTDATADHESKFKGLKAALEACAASRTITIELPNLTNLPPAFYKIGENGGAKYKVIANNLTSGDRAFMDAVNLVEAQLESLTEISANFFARANNLTKVTIAKNSRITNIRGAFTSVETSNISVTTDPSNAKGVYLEAANDSEAGPFKSVNGVKGFEFDDDAAIFVEGVSGAAPESYTLKPSSSATLYFARYWNRERYNYPNAKWSSSDPSVVSVSKSQGSEVVIKALKDGTATIKAKDDKGNTLTLTIYAEYPAPTNITFTVAEDNKYHPLGGTVYIPYTVTPADADPSQLKFEMESDNYNSMTSNGTVIEVDKNNSRLIIKHQGRYYDSSGYKNKLTISTSLSGGSKKSFELYFSGTICVTGKNVPLSEVLGNDGKWWYVLDNCNSLANFAPNKDDYQVRFVYAKNSTEYSERGINGDHSGLVDAQDYEISITQQTSDNPSRLKSKKVGGVWYLYSDGLGQSKVVLTYGMYKTQNNFTTTH